MLRAISVILLLAAMAQTADACNHWRCRRLRSCRYQQVVVQKVAVPVGPQQVVNISNVYPSGNTQYTLAQAIEPYGVNADLLGAASARIAENSVSGFSSVALAALATNPTANRVLQLQAATQLLATATSQATAPSSLTLKISQGADGNWNRIEQLGSASAADLNQGATETASVIESKCSKCHGTQLAAPKEGLFLGPDHPLSGEQVTNALRRVSSDVTAEGHMPPQGQPQMSDEEGKAFFREILALEQEQLPPNP